MLCPVCNEEIEIVQRGDVVGSQPEFVLVEEICVDGILTKVRLAVASLHPTRRSSQLHLPLTSLLALLIVDTW